MFDHGGMNRFYRLVWNEAKGCFVCIPEASSKRGKRKGGAFARMAAATVLAAAAASAAAAQDVSMTTGQVGAAVQTSAAPPAANALPTGGQVVGGAATISQSGSTQTIDQSTQNVAIDWASFSIGKDGKVVFNQPNAQAIALNRVIGSDPTQIFGVLEANGKVFLVNPNGVLFAKGSQVSTAGLLASTRDMSVADFMAGKYKLSGSSKGQVVNEGAINADGGFVALVGAQVINDGTIQAQNGSIDLAAANEVTLRLDNGGLAGLTIDKGAYDALVANNAILRADGGRIYLTAEALDAVSKASVNNTGIIEARTLANKDGKIVLLGDMETGAVNVAGTLDASAADGGDGGFIETSAAHVKIADGAKITTAAASGKTGQWLIDPVDFTIAASGGDMTGADLTTALGSTNVTIQSTSGAAGSLGDVNVNDTVTWSSNTLTLNAQNDINFNSSVAASGTGKLALEYGQATTAGTGSKYTLADGVKIDLPAGQNFSTKQGSAGTVLNYTVITSLGSLNDTGGTTLQGVQGGLSGLYVLGGDIDASVTSGWDQDMYGSYQGFRPIGQSTNTAFTGTLDGLGHTVGNLYQRRPYYTDNGLFASTSGATVQNLKFQNAYFAGSGSVGAVSGVDTGSTFANISLQGEVNGQVAGGIVGQSTNGKFYNVRVNGSVWGNDETGGVVGILNGGEIITANVAADVYGSSSGTGGIVGRNAGAVRRATYSGAVEAFYGLAGGLIGINEGSIDDSSASGAVSAYEGKIGGAVGYNTSAGSIIGVTTQMAVASSRDDVGGLVGRNEGALSYSSAVSGSVVGGENVGGAIGYNSVAVSNLTAAVGVDGSAKVGGLIGANYSANVSDSSASGDVTSEGDSIGGLIGYTQLGLISDVSASGRVSGHNAVGGLIGTNASQLTDVSATGDVTGEVYVGGLVGSSSNLNYGNNVDITNATASGDVDGAGVVGGLAGSAYGGAITNAVTSGDVFSEGDEVGGLVGNNSSAIINSHATGDVTGGNYTGGLVGKQFSMVTGSYSTGDVTGGNSVGGLVGWTESSGGVANSYASGEVKGGSEVGGLIGHNKMGGLTDSHFDGSRVEGTGSQVGGLVGYDKMGSIDNSYSTAYVTGTSEIGGLAGYTGGTVSNSYSTGEVYGVTTVGGLVGNAAGQISQSYATGDVTAEGDNAGGLAGVNGGGIADSRAEGDVYAQGDNVGGLAGVSTMWISGSHATGMVQGVKNVGGLAGASYNTISNSYASGRVQSSAQAGGLAGISQGAISDSYASGQVSGNDDVGGLVGESTASITNAYATGHVLGTNNIGGLVGDNQSTIDASNASGLVEGLAATGGLAGLNTGVLTNVQASGQVKDNDGPATGMGGLVGVNHGAVTGATASGAVSGAGLVGGLIGDNDAVLNDVHATGDVTSGGDTIGGLIGRNAATITNATASGQVQGGAYVGGAIGYNTGAVSQSSATGGVNSGNIAGGFAGYSAAALDHVSATGSLNWGGSNLGGLVGINDVGGQITNATATGNVNNSGNDHDIGGLVGINNGSISDSAANGHVQGWDRVGGLVGLTTGTIADSSTGVVNNVAGGSVVGRVSRYRQSVDIGGLVGAMKDSASVTGSSSSLNVNGATGVGGLVGGMYDLNVSVSDSFATGTVTAVAHSRGDDPYAIGGLIGSSDGVVSNSYATGTVNGGTRASAVGGLIGDVWGATVNSYATGAVSGADSVGGLGGFINWGGVTIDDSYATGSVSGWTNIGGFAGYLAGGSTITNGQASGVVNGSDSVGGFVGYVSNANIFDSSSSGAVIGVSNVGGFVGTADAVDDYATIKNSTSSSTVSGASKVGGFAGFSIGDVTFDTNTATGAASGDEAVGGFYGRAEGALVSVGNNASGAVSGKSAVGGFAGENAAILDGRDGDATTSVVTGLAGGAGGVGGFVGDNLDGGEVIYVTTTNAVTSDADDTGGIVGRNAFVVDRSTANNAVVSTGSATGGAVGRNLAGGLLDDTTTNNTVSGVNQVGGLAGVNAGEIDDSVANGAITGVAMVGGAIGENTGEVDDSIANGDVTGVTQVGGFVGLNSGDIDDAYAHGLVTGESQVGGFGGSQDGAGVSYKVYATGNVSVAGAVVSAQAGGLYGHNAGLISVAYATGAVLGGVSSEDVGGLVGFNEGAVEDAYATGAATGAANVGGLVGRMDGAASTLTNVYAKGAVTGAGAAGGLIGALSDGTVTNGYWNKDATGYSAGAGVQVAGSLTGAALTNAQSKKQASYAGFDFGADGAWKNYDGDTSPLLTAWLKDLTITVNDAGVSYVYDGQGKTDGVSNLTYSRGDATTSGHLFGAAHYDTSKNVGTYTDLTGLYSDQQGYNITFVNNGSLTITPKAVTVAAQGVNRTYDGTADVSVNLTSSGLVAGDDLTFTGAAVMADKNAGAGKSVDVSGVTGSGADAGNYTFNTTAQTTVDIAKKSITVAAQGVDKTYDGSTGVGVTLASSGLIGDDQVEFSGTGTLADKNAGQNKAVSVTGVSASGADAGNYSFASTASTTANVAKKSITVAAQGVDKTYDGSTAVGVTLSSTGLVSGDEVAFSGTGTLADKNAGLNKSVAVTSVTGAGADAGNYDYASTASTTANVARKTVTVAAQGVDKTYDGTTNVDVALTSDGVVSGDEVAFSGAGTLADKNAGLGKAVAVTDVEASGEDAGNYTYASTTSTTANVARKTVTVAAQGVDKTYDGSTAVDVVLSTDGLVEGDQVAFGGVGALADKNAGQGKSVSVTGVAATGEDADNYAYASTASTTANVVKKTVTVAAQGVDKTYDGSTNVGVTLASDGIVSGDQVAFGGVGTLADKNAGQGKSVSVSDVAATGADAGNYAYASTASTTANVAKKAITVAAQGVDKTYDGSTGVGVTLASDGVVAGDEVEFSGAGALADKNAGQGKSVSVSGVAATGADAGNYAYASTASTTANVAKKSITVAAQGVDKTYDGSTAVGVVLTSSGVIDGDLVAFTGSGALADKNAGQNKAVSVTGVAASGADAGNYAYASTASTTANIGQKSISVSLQGPVTKVANGTTAATLTSGNYVVSGLVAGEGVLVTQASGQFADILVGKNKIVSATLGAGDYQAAAGTTLGNYQLVSTTLSAAIGEITAASNPTYDAAVGTVPSNPTANVNTSSFSAVVGSQGAAVSTGDADNGVSTKSNETGAEGGVASIQTKENLILRRTFSIADGGIRLPSGVSEADGDQ